MIEKIKNEIFRALQMQIFFERIVFNFCVLDSMTEINFIDLLNFELINFMFTFRDIYNLKTQLRRKFLKLFIFIQILMREFDHEK